MQAPGPESSSRRRSSPSRPRAGGRGSAPHKVRPGDLAEPGAAREYGPAAVEGIFLLDYGWGFGGADGAPGR